MAFSDVTDCKEKRFGEAQKEGKVVGLIVWSFSIGFKDNYRVSIKTGTFQITWASEASKTFFFLSWWPESVTSW